MADEAQQILDEAQKRFDHAEVFEQTGETRSVSFENNRLKRVTARQYRGVGLRIIRDGRIGFASTTDLRDPRRLVEMAAESAQFGEQAKFQLPGLPDPLPQVLTEDPAVPEVSSDDMVTMGREGLEMSLAANADYLFSADVSTKREAIRLVNSCGLNLEHTKTDMAAAVSVETVTDSGLLHAFEFKTWGQPASGLTDITRKALDKMQQATVIAPVKAQQVPVIFNPKAVGNLLEPILLALSGKLVHKGSSRLIGKMNERILDERLDVLDDATIPFAPESASVDSEGVPTRPTLLLEKGVLRSYLLDLQTAGLLGMETTGHGYRSYASQPSPSGSNTVVGPGTDSYEDIIAGLERGVIVDQTLGSGQGNLLAGEFSVNVSLGFLVEGGKIRGRVKDCMVAGNVYDLLGQVEGISCERQWVGSDHVPAICVSGIKLAAGA